jgi:hypothetical protein
MTWKKQLFLRSFTDPQITQEKIARLIDHSRFKRKIGIHGSKEIVQKNWTKLKVQSGGDAPTSPEREPSAVESRRLHLPPLASSEDHTVVPVQATPESDAHGGRRPGQGEEAAVDLRWGVAPAVGDGSRVASGSLARR